MWTIEHLHPIKSPVFWATPASCWFPACRTTGSFEDLEGVRLEDWGVEEQWDRENENKTKWYKKRKIKKGRERIMNLISAPFRVPAFESWLGNRQSWPRMVSLCSSALQANATDIPQLYASECMRLNRFLRVVRSSQQLRGWRKEGIGMPEKINIRITREE